ncbi:MAG: hypothetical protein J6T27_01080 [Alphaproteobacteria bacterium]|nr:hypothetical protein [Alphaproteobacteria bacterium]
MLWTTKRIKHNNTYELENTIRKDVWVPEDMQTGLAQDKEMLPYQGVGKRIVVLNDSLNRSAKMTKEQAQQIMLITLAGILYGLCEYCSDQSDVRLSEKLGYYLRDDAMYMNLHLGSILENLDKLDIMSEHSYSVKNKGKEDRYPDAHKALYKELRNLSWRGYGYNHYCDDNEEYNYDSNTNRFLTPHSWNKQDLSNKYSVIFQDFYIKHDGGENPLLFVDFGKMLCRHTHPQYDARDSIFDVKNPDFQRVYDICDLIKAVRKMGNQYVCAPAFNLYGNAVLRCIGEYRKLQESR